MPRYQLYRSVVIGATGRVGEALTRQLLLSPLCSEVHVLGRSDLRAFDGLAAAQAKLHQHRVKISRPLCGIDASVLSGVNVAFCALGARGGWTDVDDVAAVERDGAMHFAELCEAAKVPHISLLSSAWATGRSRMLPFARLQGEAVDAYAAMRKFERVSIFQPSAALDEEATLVGRDEGRIWARALWRSVPVVAQFMPTRFRQIPLMDIVLAMRLNAELCDATERVEMLGFKEMMQIIGREDDV